MPLPRSEVHMIWLALGFGFALGWYTHLAKDTYLVWKLYKDW